MQNKEEKQVRTFWVFWTFIANFPERPQEVKATNIVEAIKDSTFYDPRGKSKSGQQMRFHVFSKEKGHEFSGTIDEAEAQGLG